MPLETLINAGFVDYLILLIYFVFVLGIGLAARHQVSDSLDFFLSGRSLPGWVTGLAFVSANLGAVEIMGMSANGAQIGIPTVHYFWIGAIPAMVFLGIVMMPFYYGSGVRSVPEFMLKRFGPAAHLVNAISFALAQLLIAGINLYLLGTIVHALLGWPLWVALIVAAVIVLAYISLGGLSAAIYNEVLQFFVIVASLLPLVIIGLHRVGGWNGLKAKITAAAEAHPDAVTPAAQQLHSWPGQALSGFTDPVMSVIGITLGLGFVLSFGYWTTNFVEVQRAMASDAQDSDHRRFPEDAGAVSHRAARHAGCGARAGDRSDEGGREDRRWRVGQRRPIQRLGVVPHSQPVADRPDGCRDHGPAGGVHGRYGREHLGVQHRLQRGHLAALRHQGQG